MPLYYGGTQIGGTAVQVVNPVLQNKRLTPSNEEQIAVPDVGYDGLNKVTVDPVPAVAQATPNISIDTNGKITASATQTAGYVSAGTKTGTKQLTTKSATTITPMTSEQVAVSAGTYVTGDIKVAAAQVSEDLTAVLDAQEQLINELEAELEGKASGGGAVETCTVQFERTDADSRANHINLIIYNQHDDICVLDIYDEHKLSYTLNDVKCNTTVYFIMAGSAYSSMGHNVVLSGGIELIHMCNIGGLITGSNVVVKAPSTPNAIGKILIECDDSGDSDIPEL